MTTEEQRKALREQFGKETGCDAITFWGHTNPQKLGNLEYVWRIESKLIQSEADKAELVECLIRCREICYQAEDSIDYSEIAASITDILKPNN